MTTSLPLLLCSLFLLVMVFPGGNGDTRCALTTNPCKCDMLNGTMIDISNYFSKYPIEPTSDREDTTYQYSCMNEPCEGDKSKTGVACQINKGASTYVLGRVNDATKWIVHSLDPLSFTIHYIRGDDNRTTNVMFSYKNADMESEVTSSQSKTYNISVTGNRVTIGSLCKFTFNGTTIDISDYFSKYPIEPKSDREDTTYQYSCMNEPCEGDKNKTGVACQMNKGAATYVLGKVNDATKWIVHSLDPLSFTIHYDGGDDGRKINVMFSYKDADMESEVTSSRSKTYNISVTGNRVTIGNRCKFTFNGTAIDISDYFSKYPIEPKSDREDTTYQYSCINEPCEGDNSKIGVACQMNKDGPTYVLGKVNDATKWIVHSLDPLNFTMHYDGGDDGRTTIVMFTYKDADMESKVLSSQSLTYTISVTGYRVAIGNPCKFTFNGTTIDISDYFSKYPIEPKSDREDSTYQYSCMNEPCEGDNSKIGVACQMNEGASTYVLGKVNDATDWIVHSLNPLNFTIPYIGGDDGRKTSVMFTYKDADMESKVLSSQSLTYIISITGNRVTVGTSPCKFTFNGTMIDISDYFSKYPIEPQSDREDTTYQYSCMNEPCEGDNSKIGVACQMNEPASTYVLGKVNDATKWIVHSLDPLNFTIHYDGGESGRTTIVMFTYKDADMESKVLSSQSFTYTISVTGNHVSI